MPEFKISNKGSAKLFNNKFLERLTRTPFLYPVVFFYILGIGVLVYGKLNSGIPLVHVLYLFPAGLITFTLVEYLIHRFAFHFHAETEREKQVQYNIHGVHHEFPKDKDRLVMPPVMSVLLSVLFFYFFRSMLEARVWYFYAGFLSGYSTYLIIHFAIHRMRPPGNFLRYLWTHHALHHYQADTAAFSVSFPFWDWLFRTMPIRTNKSQTDVNHVPQSGR